jgi:parvulin-like peptidyl-prolyl isomerase
MKRWLSEPFVHFLVLGALLFGGYAWIHRGESSNGDDGAGPVRITAKEIAFLTQAWGRMQQREPTREELQALVAGYLKEELLGREARAMGLELNDPIIRRRLAQKVEFIVNDTLRLTAPTADDLHHFYQANIESFQSPPRASFTQVFFNPETRRDAVAAAKAALSALSSGDAAAGDIGDPFPIDAEVRDNIMQTVAGQFGDEFANEVFALRPGAWHGPIASSFGPHLVRVTEAKPMRQPEFSEVEPQVRERWHAVHEREANEQYYEGLLKKYGVVVDESVKPVVGPLDGFAALANKTIAQQPEVAQEAQ